MKKLILTAILAMLGAAQAHAADANFDIGYSSFAAVGVRCSTGTVIRINATRPTGFTANIAGYRLVNQDSADAVHIGGVSVSSSTATGDAITNLGEKLAAGSSAAWPINKDYRSNASITPIYCLAADAAGAAGAILSVVWFGY